MYLYLDLFPVSKTNQNFPSKEATLARPKMIQEITHPHSKSQKKHKEPTPSQAY